MILQAALLSFAVVATSHEWKIEVRNVETKEIRTYKTFAKLPLKAVAEWAPLWACSLSPQEPIGAGTVQMAMLSCGLNEKSGENGIIPALYVTTVAMVCRNELVGKRYNGEGSLLLGNKAIIDITCAQ